MIKAKYILIFAVLAMVSCQWIDKNEREIYKLIEKQLLDDCRGYAMIFEEGGLYS